MLRVIAVVAVLAALVVAGCGGGGKKTSASSGGKPAAHTQVKGDITYWTGFTQRELKVMKGVVKEFEASHPGIHVKVVGGINDDKIVAAIRSGNGPDVAHSFSSDNTGAFCSSGAWTDLTPYLKRDGISPTIFPSAARYYTAYKNKRCALPMLADVYGLYYNTDLLHKAGIKGPPKTMSELAADAKKLTTHNPDGSINVLGYNPDMGWYENAVAHYGPQYGAQWVNGAGKSTLATSPGWAKLLNWQRSLINALGYDKLVRWQAGAGDEFSAANAFERGKLAMNMDGEWRVAFIANEHPNLSYQTAPMPVDDAHPELYGAGYTTGSIIGIPRTSSNKDAAWELVKYLGTNEKALAELSNGIKNVPTTTGSLKSPVLKADPKFQTFLKIFGNPHTATTPITIVGAANQELFQTFIAKWQAGSTNDLMGGLRSTDQQIDQQLANAAGGQAP